MTRVTPERHRHILDGDRSGGGHRFGSGRPGKSEFPESWSDDRIIHAIETVAADPVSERRGSYGGRTMVNGLYTGLAITVILEADGTIITGFPAAGPRNPKE